jgi:hypothetical protein
MIDAVELERRAGGCDPLSCRAGVSAGDSPLDEYVVTLLGEGDDLDVEARHGGESGLEVGGDFGLRRRTSRSESALGSPPSSTA